MKIVNCLPFDVAIFRDSTKAVTDVYPASEKPVDVVHEESCIGYINDIAVNSEYDHKVVNLPEKQKDTVYLVSGVVARLRKDRQDLVVPAGAEVNKNRTVAYTYFKKFA